MEQVKNFKRFDGEIGDMNYSTKVHLKKTLYNKKLTEITNNNKTKILICSSVFMITHIVMEK